MEAAGRASKPAVGRRRVLTSRPRLLAALFVVLALAVSGGRWLKALGQTTSWLQALKFCFASQAWRFAGVLGVHWSPSALIHIPTGARPLDASAAPAACKVPALPPPPPPIWACMPALLFVSSHADLAAHGSIAASTTCQQQHCKECPVCPQIQQEKLLPDATADEQQREHQGQEEDQEQEGSGGARGAPQQGEEQRRQDREEGSVDSDLRSIDWADVLQRRQCPPPWEGKNGSIAFLHIPKAAGMASAAPYLLLLGRE